MFGNTKPYGKSKLHLIAQWLTTVLFTSTVLLCTILIPVEHKGNLIIEDMVSRGHEINYPVSPIGGGQIILVDNEKNILIGGSDFRKDGCAIGY